MMKKRYILIPILALFLLLFMLVIIDFTIGDYIGISSIIEINVPLSCKMECIDTHGARNEGEKYVKIYFTDKKAEKFIKKVKENENWKKLPMNKDLQYQVENFDCLNENISIPENGYWFFFNRYMSYSERFENPHNRYDEKEMFDKKLWNNFSVAIFDTDTNILSYYETDM